MSAFAANDATAATLCRLCHHARFATSRTADARSVPRFRHPNRHPVQRRARFDPPHPAPGHGSGECVCPKRQPERKCAPKRHQPRRRAHGLQGHRWARLPADQPGRRAPGGRGQRPHGQRPHRLPHAWHGAPRAGLHPHAGRHRAAQHLPRGRTRARTPGHPARIGRGRRRRPVHRIPLVRQGVLRRAPGGPAGDRQPAQHPALHPGRTGRLRGPALQRRQPDRRRGRQRGPAAGAARGRGRFWRHAGGGGQHGCAGQFRGRVRRQTPGRREPVAPGTGLPRSGPGPGPPQRAGGRRAVRRRHELTLAGPDPRAPGPGLPRRLFGRCRRAVRADGD